MPDLPELFAREMRLRRQALGLSQQALGEKVGLDRNAVSRIERFAPNLAVATAADIAVALGTSLQAMIGGTDSESPPSNAHAFADKVRTLRETKGWNQRELAERLCVDRNWVSAVELSKRNVTLQTLQKFARAFDLAPVDLLS